MTHYDAGQYARATQVVASWPDFTDEQIEAVRRVVAPSLTQNRRGPRSEVPQPRMVRTDSAQPSGSRTSGPRGGDPVVAGARAHTDSTSALALTG